MNLVSSSWLDNLLAYSLQIGLLVAVAGLLPWLLRVHAPRMLLRYYQVLLLACLALPAIQPWEPGSIPVAPLNMPDQVFTAERFPGQSTLSEGSPDRILRGSVVSIDSVSLPALAAGVLLAGFVVRMFWLSLGVLRLALYRRRSQPMELTIPVIDDILISSGVRPQIRISTEVRGPATFGLWRPVVLLPMQFSELPETHQRAIVCHELLHVRRRDWLFALLEQALGAIFWFHPGMWWLFSRIRLKREQAVDEQVVALLQDRRQYAHALLEFAGARLRPSMTPAPLFLTEHHLTQRVSLILKEASMPKSRMVVSLTSMVVFLFVAGIAAVWAFPLIGPPQILSSPQEQSRQGRQPTLSFNSAGKIVPPRLIEYVEPEDTAQLPRSSGQMKMLITIDEQGKVWGRFLLSGNSRRIQSILAAVSRWRFKPATLNGLPVGYTAILELNWALQDGKVRISGQPSLDLNMQQRPQGQIGILYQRIEPAYPEAAIRQGVEGDVLVNVWVDEWGRVRDAQVLEGPEQLRAAAMQAVWQYRYSACMVGDEAVPFEAKETLSFLLPRSGPAAMTGRDSQVREIGEKDMYVRVLYGFQPDYPEEALKQGATGPVRLRVLVNETGEVEDAQVIDGPPLLHEAALAAIRQYRYTPVLAFSESAPNGKPVCVLTTQMIAFSVPESARIPAEAPGTVTQAQSASATQQTRGAIRVGGNVQATKLIHRVEPIYPDEAKSARVSGVVIMQVLIDEVGNVTDVKVLRGNPLLDSAAIEAVRQWRYSPSFLNGEPVSVIAAVTVIFSLGQDGKPESVLPAQQDASRAPATATVRDVGSVASAQVQPASATQPKGQPIRVGGNVQATKLIKRVEPIYPDVAKNTGVQGVVLLQVQVDEEGQVADVKIIRGHPLLEQSAMEAVRQWRYSPTFLNGEPVSVIATVTVIFSLPQ
jgi:TonB family protein